MICINKSFNLGKELLLLITINKPDHDVLVYGNQCDQIGLLMKDLGDKFSFESSLNKFLCYLE